MQVFNIRVLPRIPVIGLRCFSTTPAVGLYGKIRPIRKMKTHQGTAKRWSAIASGKFKRKHAGKQHLNAALSQQRLNAKGQTVYGKGWQISKLKKLLPYFKKA